MQSGKEICGHLAKMQSSVEAPSERPLMAIFPGLVADAGDGVGFHDEGVHETSRAFRSMASGLAVQIMDEISNLGRMLSVRMS